MFTLVSIDLVAVLHSCGKLLNSGFKFSTEFKMLFKTFQNLVHFGFQIKDVQPDAVCAYLRI